MAELTTTSFAILSLLAVRSWTSYELAKQMDRSVGHLWPRAESVVYEEPKRLVHRGLAAAEQQRTGNRTRTVYAITPAGRATLREWLDVPGDAPKVEFEALLKVAFADQGSLDGLRENVAAIRRHAEQEVAEVARRAREYAETGGPHPDRLAVIALALHWFREQALATLRWATWAETTIAGWSGVTPDTGAAPPPDAFG